MKTIFYFLIVLSVSANMYAQTSPRAWLLKGNNGTVPAINFVGTKDTQPLVFRVNNKLSGYIELDNSKANTSFGYQSLKANTSVNNTAFGYNTLSANTNGQYNVAVGSFNLSANTTGLGNTAVGAVALVANSTGSFNTAVGENALIGNTTGEANTGVGNQTLAQNKIGHDNVALGSLALYFNTADFNTALGSNSLYDNTTGHDNTAAGLYSLYRSLSGNNNTALGNGAMFNNLDGSNNTAVGNSALYLPLHGNNCTALGFNANVSFERLNNATVIGYNAVVDASNKVRIGNTAVTSIGGQVGWTNFSDARIKKDIKENVPGLAFINALRPVTYHFNAAKENELLGIKAEKENNDIERINFTGLLAQEVDAAAKKINYDFSGVDKTGKIWGLRYSEFVVPLIKAVQELSLINNEKDARIDDLQRQINELKAMILSGKPTEPGNGNQAVGNASLEQNTPNPFSNSTTISYFIPDNNSAAYINFYSLSGDLLKSVYVTKPGKGAIGVKASELPANAIRYSLIINNKIADSKQMLKIK